MDDTPEVITKGHLTLVPRVMHERKLDPLLENAIFDMHNQYNLLLGRSTCPCSNCEAHRKRSTT